MRLGIGNRDSIMRQSNVVMRALEVIRTEGIVEFLRKALAYIRLEPLILPYALLEIKRVNSNSLDDLVDFCFHGVGGLIRPLQIRDEIMELLRILNKTKPRVVIEIGTAGGGTLFSFCHVAAEDATIISIDFPDVRFGGGYPMWKTPLYKAFRLPKQKLHLLRADSHNQETLDKVMNILGDREVDFLFIDGDHAYEGVKKDFEMFSPLVKKDGVIALHDIVVHPAETGCGVSKFWNEIKQGKYKWVEIINERNQNSCGIGLLFRSFKR